MFPEPRVDNTGGLVVGLLVMALGIGLLLDRTGILVGFGWHNFWPWVLIAVGLIRLSILRDDGRRVGGWMLFLGLLLLLNQTHVLRFQESWPLFVVSVGLTMVWKEVFPRGSRVHERVE
jgi:cell wall-active antibiotic response 4TMS protein YvqF